ncbi:putative ABC-type xenobiotic transporter [Helianthus anomalus]
MEKLVIALLKAHMRHPQASEVNNKDIISHFVLRLVYCRSFELIVLMTSNSLLSRSFLLMQAGYETANQLFDKMYFSIFRAPMSFFDANPSGRILSRVNEYVIFLAFCLTIRPLGNLIFKNLLQVSSVQTAVDLSIPYSFGPFSYAIIQLLGIVLVMSLSAWPVFLVFFPVVGICIWLQQYYIPSARELARLVGVCKAPVIQHFSETISGSTTIRSFDKKHKFKF